MFFRPGEKTQQWAKKHNRPPAGLGRAVWPPDNARFWLFFGAIFGLHFGLFLGPLRGPVLSENIRKTKRFEAFWPPEKAQFGAHFGPAFRPVLGSILGSFLGAFWEAGRTQFPVVLGLAWPGPKAGVRRFSPRPSHVNNFLENLLGSLLRKSSRRKVPSLVPDSIL